jgi:hypothetical protein
MLRFARAAALSAMSGLKNAALAGRKSQNLYTAHVCEIVKSTLLLLMATPTVVVQHHYGATYHLIPEEVGSRHFWLGAIQICSKVDRQFDRP